MKIPMVRDYGPHIATAAAQRVPETLEILQQLVMLESPSDDKSATDRVVTLLEDAWRTREAHIERLPQTSHGDFLIGRFGSGSARPALVITHVDTVWPVGTLDRLPWRIEGDRVSGPGVLDMKASIAMMLTALDILRDRDLLRRPIIWFVNTDEEIGSPASRPILEKLAGDAEFVLCLEPPEPPDGALKTQRKGVGAFTLEVEGRAAHAGIDPRAGLSALEELAHQILWLQGLTDHVRGTTVNVGIAGGGTQRNVVAAHARAEIDLRVTTAAEADRIVPLILSAKPRLAGTTIRVSGGLHRPPMERTVNIAAAFERAREIGQIVGLELTDAATGGGSDGNFTAALGVTTLDGLGCPGTGAHADNEHILLSALGPRTALLAALLIGL